MWVKGSHSRVSNVSVMPSKAGVSRRSFAGSGDTSGCFGQSLFGSRCRNDGFAEGSLSPKFTALVCRVGRWPLPRGLDQDAENFLVAAIARLLRDAGEFGVRLGSDGFCRENRSLPTPSYTAPLQPGTCGSSFARTSRVIRWEEHRWHG